VFAPLGFYAFGYALNIGGFRLESRRARERLDALLQAEALPHGLPARYWPEDLRTLWGSIQAAGPLGFGWVACYPVGVALAIYDWAIRQAGCTNQQEHDSRYFCPSDAHVFSVWAFAAVMVGAMLIGIGPVRRRRSDLLAVVLAVQRIAIVALAWIAQDASFHVHHR
jgi:hypothetical protein